MFRASTRRDLGMTVTNVPVIETERLLLREWRDGDVADYAEICSDREVMRYMWGGVPQPDALVAREVEELMAHWERLGFGHWAIEERATGLMVGRTGIKRHDDWDLDPENTEVGWLYARSRWGRGYATEAALAAVRFAFEELDRPEVISIAHVDNAASQRVMEKAGLKRQGERPWRGMDVAWWALSREAWDA